LLNLQKRYLPNSSAIVEDLRADYRFRLTAKKKDVAAALALIVHDLKYNNFKDEVGRKQGFEREMIYSDVWATLRQLQEDDGAAEPDADVPLR
jgi:hypothetical protein